eukprot:TRINITY_DN1625_c0_g1_i5.p1 TRINITY_DN1625_c0_g1~~TRINITY_DN1625_c0_g1_i5.p1  ORF type:complete len:2391 (+),score=774.34 TRINITY_DN1625_c0_g1_i5:133-7305(+)
MALPPLRSTVFGLVFLIVAASGLEQCSDDSFAIAYEGQTFFAVDKFNGVCSCDTFQATRFLTANGTEVGSANYNLLLSNYTQLRDRLASLQAQFNALTNANAQALGGACFNNADCLANLTLVCSAVKLRCLGAPGAACMYNSQCVEGTYCSIQNNCTAVQCAAVSAPAGGQLKLSNLGRYPSTANYTCSSGYTMAGTPVATCNYDGSWTSGAPTCIDINECATNSGGCSPFATCNNTIGSYTCTCQSGMLGDGFTCAGAKANCWDLFVSSNKTLPSGYYLVGSQGVGGTPLSTYCDMVTDGGGWQVFYTALNGAGNIPGYFENAPAGYVCTDPGKRCIRRVPTEVDQTYSFIAVCGSQSIKFSLTSTLVNYFRLGTTYTSWIAVPTVSLTPMVLPFTYMYWISSSGWILSSNQGASGTFASGYSSTSYDYCNGVNIAGIQGSLMFRPPTGDVVRTSCLQILMNQPNATSGVYMIKPDGPAGPNFPYEVYCDMTTDGGGWTATFVGQQGSFYYFNTYDNVARDCPDTATQCMRRIPNEVDTSYSMLATCGTGAIKFQLTSTLVNQFKSGTTFSFSHIPAPQAIPGTATYPFGQLWMNAGSGWILSGASSGTPAASQTFTSSYSGSSSYDLCNGQVTNGKVTRLAYRENIFTGVPKSCNAWKQQNSSLTSGVYWIDPDGAGPAIAIRVYCDMSIDGGGWTSFHTFRSGSTNVFDRFENTPSGAWNCPDPNTQCMYRLPATINMNYTVMAQCGNYSIKFMMTTSMLSYFQSGTVSSWTVVPGAVPVTPGVFSYGAMNFYAGTSNYGWALASSTSGGTATFASSYTASTSYDYCNGIAGTGVPSRLYYREANFGGEPLSCLEIQRNNASATSGMYWIDPDGPGPLFPYDVYCDMDHDGGGWTSFFVGTNGKTSYFDRFDATAWNCIDSTSRCLRSLPPRVDLTFTLMATCGDSAVKFNIPSTTVLNYFQTMGTGLGTSWVELPGALPAPIGNYTLNPVETYAFSQMFLYASSGWVLASKSTAGTTTFASSNANTGYDYCNGQANAISPIKLFYRASLKYNLPISCLDVIKKNPQAKSGVYWIDDDGDGPKIPYKNMCEMNIDGGGYTEFFVANSGYTNYFNAFESTAWDCTNPGTKCLRRLPSRANVSYTVVATCGTAALRFQLNPTTLAYFQSGSGSGAVALSYAVQLVNGMQPVPASPGAWYLRMAFPNFFISPNNANPVFTSATSTTGYDYCNGISISNVNNTRLLYREVVDTEIWPTSCLDIKRANASAGSGEYTIDPDGPWGPIVPYRVYCENQLDGGGYTAFWVSRQGQSSSSYTSGFEQYVNYCPDPSGQCLRRLPPVIDTTYTLMAVCGSQAMKFLFTTQIIGFFTSATQQGSWQQVIGAKGVTAGAMSFPNGAWVYLGGGSSYGWIIGASTAGASAFSSSYTPNTGYDYCNGNLASSTPAMLYYRPNTNDTVYPLSCLEIIQNNPLATSKVYTIDSDGPGPNFPEDVYCDMVIDGGGWTAFLNTKGGTSYWSTLGGGFDQTVKSCPDPETSCQYRLPARVTANYHLLAQCGSGSSSVKLAMNPSILNYFKSGTVLNDYIAFPAMVEASAGIYPFNGLQLYTYSGRGWFICGKQRTLATTFANSYYTTGMDACNGVAGSGGTLRLYYREKEPTFVPYPRSCQEVLWANSGSTSGLYWIDPDGTGPMFAYRVWCDMDLDGGGWTSFWRYTANGAGAGNALDIFDSSSYSAVWNCPDPTTNCMRRLPAPINSSYTFLMQCGAQAMKATLPQSVFNYFQTGAAPGWVSLYGSPFPFAPVSNGVNTLPSFSFYGSSGFMFTHSWQTANSFMSTYTPGGYDQCNSISGTAFATRLYYREPQNNTIFKTCLEIKRAYPAATSGEYIIDPDGPSGPLLSYKAYCDMVTDGGGWTAFIAGPNGQTQYAALRQDQTQWYCPDPTALCMRRLPEPVDMTFTFAVACGNFSIKFTPQINQFNYFKYGTSYNTVVQLNSPVVLTPGVIPVRQLWMYQYTTYGWFVSTSSSYPANTVFASSYINSYNYCNGQADSTSQMRFFYREPMNTTFPLSCKEIKDANPAAPSRNYTIDADGPGPLPPYDAYCDMDTDGGGWTAFYAGMQGSSGYFNQFINTPWDCVNPSTQCLRRFPANIGLNYTLMATCGSKAIKFTMTSAIYNLFSQGTVSNWVAFPTAQPVTPGVMPFTGFQIYGGPTYDWIISDKGSSGTSTFSATYSGSTSYNWCNGLPANNLNTTYLYYRSVAQPPQRSSHQHLITSSQPSHQPYHQSSHHIISSTNSSSASIPLLGRCHVCDARPKLSCTLFSFGRAHVMAAWIRVHIRRVCVMLALAGEKLRASARCHVNSRDSMQGARYPGDPATSQLQGDQGFEPGGYDGAVHH